MKIFLLNFLWLIVMFGLGCLLICFAAWEVRNPNDVHPTHMAPAYFMLVLLGIAIIAIIVNSIIQSAIERIRHNQKWDKLEGRH